MINIFGEPLKSCCSNPVTGYFRDGFCRTDEFDYGSHTVCAIVTEEFLEYSKSKAASLSSLLCHARIAIALRGS